MFRNWLKQMQQTTFGVTRPGRARRKSAVRPQLEALEGRLAPAVFRWTGVVSTAWNTAGNWVNPQLNPGQPDATARTAPAAGDDLVFPGGAQRTTNQTIGFTDARIFKSITYTAGGYSVAGGGNVRVGEDGLSMTATTGTVNISGCLNLTGAANTVTVAAGGRLNLNNDGSLTGSTTLSKEGGGILSLDGNNSSYAGAVVVEAGVLRVDDANALGTTAGTTQVNSGGSLVVGSASVTTAEPLTLNAGATFGTGSNVSWAGPITVAGNATLDTGGTLTLSGGLSGSGDLTKSGTARVVLASSNTGYTGDFFVNNGTLEVRYNNALGTTGGTTTVSDGGTLRFNASAGALTIAETIVLGTVGTAAAEAVLSIGSGEGSATLNGGLQFVDNAVIQVGNIGVPSEVLTLNGTISGAGGFTKDGNGTLTLDGTANNTYSGVTSVLNGTVNLAKTGGTATVPTGLIAIPGDLSISSASVVLIPNKVNGVTTPLTGSQQIGLTADVIVNNGGTFDLNNNSQTIASLSLSGTLVGGLVTTGTGTLSVAGAISASDTNSLEPPEVAGKLNLGAASRTIRVDGPATDLIVSATISGTGGLRKEGTGDLELSGGNTYAGDTVVAEGVVRVVSNNALGNNGGTFNPNGTTPEDRTAGGTIVLSGARLDLAGGLFVDEFVVLAGGTLRGLAGGSTTLETGIDLFAASTIEQQGTATLTLDGRIDGPAGFTKTGSGTVRIFSNNQTADSNFYDGPTTVLEGTLRLDKLSGFSIPNSTATLTVGQDAANAPAATVISASDTQIGTAVNVVIRRSGLLDTNGNDEDVGQVELIGGTITTGLGSLTVNGLTSRAADVSATIDGNLTLTSAASPFAIEVEDGSAVSDLVIPANVTVAANRTVEKRGPGRLVLAGDNVDLLSPIAVSNGIVRVAADMALGAPSAGTTVLAGGTIEVTTSDPVFEPLTLNGSGFGNGGALADNQATPVLWRGPITLATASTVQVQSSGTLTLNGVISGPGNLTKTGPATLVITEAGLGGEGGSVFPNDYTGVTTVSAGVLRITTSTALGATSGDTVVQSGAALEVQGAVNAPEPLTLNGAGLADAGALRSASGSNTWSGTINLATNAAIGGTGALTVSGVISGPGSLTKVGTGTLAFTGASPNTFAGTTTAAAGTLRLSRTAGVNAVPGSLVITGGAVQVAVNQQLPDNATVTINNGPGLQLQAGVQETVGPLSLDFGRVQTTADARLILNADVTATGTSTLGNLDLGAQTRLFNVTSAAGALNAVGLIEGAAGVNLVKEGPGLVLLGASNTYAGDTIVNGGQLFLSGITVPSNTVTVNANGVLQGSGTVNNLAVAGGMVRPSFGQVDGFPGILTVNGDLTFSGNAILDLTLNGTVPGAANGHDQLRITGANRTVTLGNVLLTGTSPSTLANTPPLIVIDNQGTGTSTTAGTFSRLDANGARVPFLPGTDRVNLGAGSFSVVYNAGAEANDVRLTREGPANSGSAFRERSATASADEGGVVTVTGTIVEPDADDTFTLEVNWGDGSDVETFTVSPRDNQPLNGQVLSVSHRYLDDNPTGTPSDSYTIGLAWFDAIGAGNTGTLTTTINNVAPEVSTLAATGGATGESVVLTGEVIDPGADGFQVTIDWGDGSPAETVTLDGVTFFSPSHAYATAGTFTVSVTAADDDGGSHAASTTVAVGFADPTTAYVDTVFRELLGREGDAEGLAFWTNALNNGTTRDQFVQAVFSTNEARLNAAQEIARAALDRPFDPTTAQFVADFFAGGGTVDQLRAVLLGSAEFFQQSGGSDQTFLAALYQEVLGRAIDEGGRQFFLQQLAGGMSRETVAMTLLRSREADQRVATELFQSLLGRAPDEAGLAALVGVLQGGLSDLAVTAAILQSEEFAGR